MQIGYITKFIILNLMNRTHSKIWAEIGQEPCVSVKNKETKKCGQNAIRASNTNSDQYINGAMGKL